MQRLHRPSLNTTYRMHARPSPTDKWSKHQKYPLAVNILSDALSEIIKYSHFINLKPIQPLWDSWKRTISLNYFPQNSTNINICIYWSSLFQPVFVFVHLLMSLFKKIIWELTHYSCKVSGTALNLSSTIFIVF